MSIQTVLKQNYVLDLVRTTCGQETEIIERPAAFFVRSINEGDRRVERVIILPPRGFTANAPDQMNSHDEAEAATIEVKGAVRGDRKSFSVQKDCVFVASIDKGDMVSDLNEPYLTYDIDNLEPHVQTSMHSAGTAPFNVVRSNGYGFYHNIVNVTDDWLVLKLVKILRPQKSVDLESTLSGLDDNTAEILRSFYEGVAQHGDEIFEEKPDLIGSVCNLDLAVSLPALGEMLYIHDTGKHEACTVFATILKIGRQHPETVMGFLQTAIDEKTVPTYYAEQLMGKINRSQEGLTATGTVWQPQRYKLAL